ncbi:MAG: AAA family ATPase [Candidatus Pacebacteria bacterium]|nr:AAA family ATPase [Candidatus Paceibacterota bacterium]
MQVIKTPEFQQAYQQLNSDQKRAVDSIDGPVMVVAGPGTGKTQVLTARIANILLKTDTNPSSILALTFTDSAARNMRDRLVQLIGQTGYYVQISTFHSFCAQVIRDNPEQFPLDPDSQPLTELERYQLFEELIDQAELDKMRPLNKPYLYLGPIISAISDLKREGVSPNQFEKIVRDQEAEFAQVESELNKAERTRFEKNLVKYRELLQLYRAYQQELRANQRFDFDDMIALVVEAFEQDELFLRDYQERLHYFLVDEYQDTNTAQNKVVDLLASYWQEMSGNPNVFVVGDPNQAIFRFQGASVENMLGFIDRYPNCELIALTKGYRCPQPIYNQASQLIRHNKLLSGGELDGGLEGQELKGGLKGGLKGDLDGDLNGGLESGLEGGLSGQLSGNDSKDQGLESIKKEVEKAGEASQPSKPDSNVGLDSKANLKSSSCSDPDFSNSDPTLVSDQHRFFSLLNQTLDSARSKESGSQFPALRLFEAPVQTLETVFVAEEIKNLIDQGTDPAKIAVLYLYNSDAVEVAQALEKWGIRYEIGGGGDILQTEFITKLLNTFQALLELRQGGDPDSETRLIYEVMQADWFDLPKLSLMKLGRVSGQLKVSLVDLIDRGYSWLEQKGHGQLLTEEQFSQFELFMDKLASLAMLDLRTTFDHWFEQALKDLGVLDWLGQQPDKIELLTQLNSLYNQIKSMTAADHQFKLADFLQAIEIMKGHKIKIKQEDLNIHQNAVQLSTVHSAKGQEWDHVFVIHCIDKRWGNSRQQNLLQLPEGILTQTDLSVKERNEDARRVFYVALTRAKKSVTISYPQTFVKENQTSSAVASQFLTELDQDQLEQVEASELVENAEEFLLRLIEPPVERQVTVEQEEYFRKLVGRFSLSVTALNGYLRDPEEFVENTLLRVPRAKPMPMIFGSAVHAALEKMFKAYQNEGQKPPEEFVLEQFQTALKSEVLTKKDFKERLKYGQEVLSNYYQQTLEDQPDVWEVERSVGSGSCRAVLDDIYLTGRLDRIDWLDRDKKQVMVIDYKTGKPKTKGYIEGQTKSANLSEREQDLPESIRGPYKRQLLFYKLLAQLDKTFLPEVTHGMFDFIEPYDPKSGRLMPRKFELKDDDVKDLKQLIRQVMKEIRNLEFLR